MRKLNLVAGIALVLLGAAMIAGATVVPLAAGGLLAGGISCLASGAFCIWWSRITKGTIFDGPSLGIRSSMAHMADSTARANGVLAGLVGQGVCGPGAVPARARVTQAHDTGLIVNGRSVVNVHLRVDLPGAPPYDATVRQALSPLSMAQLFRDADVAVAVDPADPQRVSLVLAA